MFVWAMRDKGSEWRTVGKFLIRGALPFTPLVEAVCEPIINDGKSPVALITALGAKIAPLTTSGRVWLDLGHLRRIYSANDVVQLCAVARRSCGLLIHNVTPVIRASAPNELVDAVFAWAHEEGSGACIRIDGITGLSEKMAAVKDLVTTSGLSGSEIDIIFDAEDLPRALSYAAIRDAFPVSQIARNWVVLAGSFPASVTEMRADQYEHRLERAEWITWREEATQAGDERFPEYGDYATQGAVYSPSPPFPGSPTVRYTAAEDYVILRGRGGVGADFGQYVGHARYLREQAYYREVVTTPGDVYAEHIASGTQGTGNATTWRVASLERHLHVVAAQVQRFAPALATTR